MEPIRSTFEDDPDMMDIVQEFAAELPKRAAELRSLFEGDQLEALRTLAHQLKGAGGGYGFAPITEAAAALEQALKDGAGRDVVDDRCTHLCDVLDAVEVPEGS